VPASKGRDASRYLFLIDPLCGWCYAAMPQVTVLRAHIGAARLDVMPTGLFAGKGARPMTRQFRDYAWSNDQRITELTGQVFSQAYYDQVLSDVDRAFDSGPASLILALADLLQPGRGFDLLTALQHARFVEGRHLGDQETLVAVAATSGFERAQIMAAFQNAAQLEEAVDRITAGRRELARHSLEGVPALIQQTGDENRIIPNALLVGPAAELVAYCGEAHPN